MQLSDALDFVSTNRNGMLIALKSNGRPQSSNIAYTMGAGDDAGKILISVTDGRAKTKRSCMRLKRSTRSLPRPTHAVALRANGSSAHSSAWPPKTSSPVEWSCSD